MTSTIKTHRHLYIVPLFNIAAISMVAYWVIAHYSDLSVSDINFDIFAITINLAAIAYAMISIIKAKHQNKLREKMMNAVKNLKAQNNGLPPP